MRRLVTPLMLFLLALALAPAASAQYERQVPRSAESVSLEDGVGYAIVTSRDGVMWGSVGRGRIVITDYRRGARTEANVSGCEQRRRVNRLTILCIGRALSFEVIDGSWRVALRGSRINASARLVGSLTLAGRGTGEVDGREFDWPRSENTLALG